MSWGWPIRPMGIRKNELIFHFLWHADKDTRVNRPGPDNIYANLPRRSIVQVRAKERTAALLALSTLNPSKLFTLAMEPVMMIDAPSRISGRAFCTVKSVPRTLPCGTASISAVFQWPPSRRSELRSTQNRG